MESEGRVSVPPLLRTDFHTRSVSNFALKTFVLLTSVRFPRCITTFSSVVNRNGNATYYDLITILGDTLNPSIQGRV